MEELFRIKDAILADSIASFFSVIIGVWLILATIALFLPVLARSQFGGRLITITPNSLATLGVLGTFTGILIGLLDFDVEDVSSSVPKLLVGLKIAFTTSIVGIAGSILFRLIRTISPEAVSSSEISPQDIYSVLKEIRDDGRQAASASKEQIQHLRDAISSDNDTSLVTQVQKLRTVVQDGQTEMVKEFREFAEHMVENNQKAIIEALEQVIRDFNQNLTEQFGENFKELNSGVKTLVEWQENYRGHVEGMQRRLDAAVTSIEAVETSLAKVEEHAAQIPPAIEKLEPALSGINAQSEMLSANLEAVALLHDKAIEAFPIIEENLQKVTTDLSASVNDAVSKSQTALSDQQDALNTISDGYALLLENAETAQGKFSESLNEALSRMNEIVSAEFSRHGELIQAAADSAQKSIVDAWASSSEKIDAQFGEFDKQMQQELERSLELLGNSLASLSEKFVEDYGPLTDKLQSLVNSSRAIR